MRHHCLFPLLRFPASRNGFRRQGAGGGYSLMHGRSRMAVCGGAGGQEGETVKTKARLWAPLHSTEDKKRGDKNHRLAFAGK